MKQGIAVGVADRLFAWDLVILSKLGQCPIQIQKLKINPF
jgi:hypothetical protein